MVNSVAGCCVSGNSPFVQGAAQSFGCSPARQAHIGLTCVQLEGHGFLCHLAEVAPYVLLVRDVRECGGL